MDDVGKLRLRIGELEEERRELLSRNQALEGDVKAAALHGQGLLERCAQLGRERDQLEEENKQLEEELERYRREHPEENASDGSRASSGRASSTGPWPDEPPRTSYASQSPTSQKQSQFPVSQRQSMTGEAEKLRQQNFVQMQHAQELERDLSKKDELVRALEEQMRGVMEQLAEQRRQESTLLQKLEKEKGGLAERLEELNIQVRAQEKTIASLGQQLGTAQAALEDIETAGGKERRNWRTAQAAIEELGNLHSRSRLLVPPLNSGRRHSSYDTSPRHAPADDDGLGDGSRELLETFAQEFRSISGSQQSLVSNMDAKIRDVQERLESLSVTLHKPNMRTQATMDCLQMEDTGEILSTLQELQEKLVTVHTSVGSLMAQSDTRAALGEAEGTIKKNLQSFQDQLRAKLEALQEQQDSSSRQLLEKFEVLHEQHESLGGLVAQKALAGLSAERRDSDRGEAERLHREVVRLCEQLAAKLEGTRAGCEQELARAVEGFQLEKESLGDIIAQKALDRLSAERCDSNSGEAERLRQEVTRLHEQLAAKQQELATTAEGFQLEKAGLLQMLGSALDGLRVEKHEASRDEAEQMHQEVARLCDQLTAKLEGTRAGCQQDLARAVQGFQLEKADLLQLLGSAIEARPRAPQGAAESQKASEELEREAQRLRTELAGAERRVEDGIKDRLRLSRAVEGARRDMAELQAENERLRAAPDASASELREEVARLRRQLAAEKEAQKRIKRQADTDVLQSLVALRDLDENLFSPPR